MHHWNYCNELQVTVFQRERRLLSGYDFAKFTRGATREGLHLHSQSVQAIAEEYAARRRQCGRVRLKWRKSGGSQRSWGWLPFKAAAIRVVNGQVKFAGQWFSMWDSYGLSGYSIRCGNLCEDARGRWYLNACVAVPKGQRANKKARVRVCSACSARSGPQGIAGIGIREWTCSECGTGHDRDVNAAKNILAAGRRRLAEGIP